MPMEYAAYKVKKGDNLHKIAKRHGYPAADWRKIYDHKKNADFRRKRPDPNMIKPGDVVLIPKTPLAVLKMVHKSLFEALGHHGAGMPPLKGYKATLEALEKEAARLKKQSALTKADLKRAETAVSAAATAYRNANEWAGLCRGSIGSDPAMTRNIVCYRDTTNAYRAASRWTDAQKHYAVVKALAEKDAAKAKKAAEKLEQELAKMRKKHEAWLKDHQKLEAELLKAIKEVECMMAEAI